MLKSIISCQLSVNRYSPFALLRGTQWMFICWIVDVGYSSSVFTFAFRSLSPFALLFRLQPSNNLLIFNRGSS